VFRDRVKIVGIADLDPTALHSAGDALGVPGAARCSSFEGLCAQIEADVCFLVVPPAVRTEAVRLASTCGMAVLCEKPIAASWEQSIEIASRVRESGIKFAVTQNYRQANRIRALKRVLRRPNLGAINLLQCRLGVDYTIETAGGAFRHQIPDALIYEGAEHHIDQFRNLLDADGAWVQGVQWNQPWSTFANNCCVALTVGMANGAVVQYELNHIVRGHQNGWHNEYYRVECEGGTVTLDGDHVIRITRRVSDQREETEEVLPDTDLEDGHFAVINGFLDWLDGGPPPVTVAEDNLRTMALTFAAVEATHSGHRITVPTLPDWAGGSTASETAEASLDAATG
jgi:predicted dehydrogenase